MTYLAKYGNSRGTRRSLAAVSVETDPQRRLQVAATESIRFLYESADLLLIARREVPGVREQMVANFVSFYSNFLNLLKDALVQGIEMKTFRPLNPEDAARVFMTMIQGNFAFAYLTGTRVETPEKAAERMLDIFFKGILA